MDVTEMMRLQKGQKLMGKIEKTKAQIESLNDVKYINLGTTKETKIPTRSWEPDKTFEQVVNYNIVINPADKNPHPFTDMAATFVHQLSMVLQEKVKQLQKEFDEL